MSGEGGEGSSPSLKEIRTPLPSAKDAELQRARTKLQKGEALKPINLQQLIVADLDTTLDDKASMPKEKFKERMLRLKDLREYALNLVIDEPLMPEEKQRQRAELGSYLTEKEQHEKEKADDPLASQNADVFKELQQVVNGVDTKKQFSDEEIKAFLQQAEAQLVKEDEVSQRIIEPTKLLAALRERAQAPETPLMNEALQELQARKEKGEKLTLTHLLPVMDAEALDMAQAQEVSEQSEVWKALDAITKKAQQYFLEKRIPAGEFVYIDVRSLEASTVPPENPHMPFNNHSLAPFMDLLHPRNRVRRHAMARAAVKQAARVQTGEKKKLKESSQNALSYLREHRETGEYKDVFKNFFDQIIQLQQRG